MLYERAFKRLFDLAIAVPAMLVLSPLFLITAMAIRLEDGAPVLFRQRRVGRSGSIFTIYKFRSMPVGTPNLPSAVARSLSVTRVGRIIRRTNVDELPQLWNILMGDMSLIGPRPALESQTSLLLARTARGVSCLRPGLTGLAQVNAYDGMPEVEKVEWESRYAQCVSFTLDLAIVAQTVLYLTRRPPAY